MEIDYNKPIETFEKVKKFLDEIKTKVDSNIPEGVQIIGNAVIGKDVKFTPPVVIEGPVFIGEKCSIGPFAHIRPYCYLEGGNHIGFSSQIKESIFMLNSNAPHLNYIGDSIIGRNCNLGAGTITANLRFDNKNVKISGKIDSGRRKLGVIMEDNVKTGINVSIMPGVKIGDNNFVSAHTIVSRDIE